MRASQIRYLEDLGNRGQVHALLWSDELFKSIEGREPKFPESERKYFLDAIKLDKKNVNAMNGLAAFYKKKGDTEKHRYYLNEVLKINPNDEVAKKILDSLNAK